MSDMKLTSIAFGNHAEIPAKYGCQGQDINPPLSISGVPEGTRSLVLIMTDPDAPNGLWTHWVMWNIDPHITRIEENSIPPGAMQGTNSWGKKSYGGPCPPSGTHRYFFKLYALKNKIELTPSATSQVVEQSIKGLTLGTAELMGIFSKR